MNTAVRDHQTMARTLSELDAEIEQKRVERCVMRWMNDDLLLAHEQFAALDAVSDAAVFQRAYTDGAAIRGDVVAMAPAQVAQLAAGRAARGPLSR